MAEQIDLNTAIVALLRLVVAEREERSDRALAERRIEILLHEVGLSHAQIAAITGKQPDAVRMAIARSREKTKKGGSRASRSRRGVTKD